MKKSVVFWIFVLLFLVFSLSVIGQEKTTRPVIALAVSPKVFLYNPFTKTEFRVRWQIDRHQDNRAYSVSVTCTSGYLRSTLGDMEGENSPFTFPEWYLEVSTGGSCQFEACVYRYTGKPYKCVRQEVESIGDEP